MKNKYRNIFFLFGLIAIAIMLWKFDMSWDELWSNLSKAGIWFPAVVILWVFIYMMNALSWFCIINDGENKSKVPYWKVYKFTITGFALNYTTPVGLMGGEPYRIMELSPYVGTAKATSSVILYVMMHIFSHFCFWIMSLVLFLCLYFDKINAMTGILLAIIGFVCFIAVYFFMKGYKNGLAMKGLRILTHLPFIKNWAKKFIENKRESIEKVDQQIADLHKQRKVTFYTSLGLEFGARVVGCVEIYFILLIFTSDVSFLDCILIQAFSSLFANALFFSPMQLGAREGGLAIITSELSMKSAFGVTTGLITRVRELIWIVIGMALMKVGNGRKN
ncbi:MAG: flippase-like domain-containing protein [Bacteroidaceae bacterium]|nr:flippase-like domain-containing protein [Candidatus Minthousia equi]MCQ2245334.1 flippase-like domain-containing protein [Bacteroidaceae bacterium]MDO4957417.1 lysylphosphatidylglycerol synthase transmembrane domain-containing protein [Bacteroidales bacterium]